MPVSTVTTRYRVANVNAINCDLSPNSATKMTPKLTTSAAKNPSTASSRDIHTGQDARDDLDPAHLPEPKVSLTPQCGAMGPGSRTSQYVDHHVGSYSPSRSSRLADARG
jgi:hypothetical protein